MCFHFPRRTCVRCDTLTAAQCYHRFTALHIDGHFSSSCRGCRVLIIHLRYLQMARRVKLATLPSQSPHLEPSGHSCVPCWWRISCCAKVDASKHKMHSRCSKCHNITMQVVDWQQVRISPAPANLKINQQVHFSPKQTYISETPNCMVGFAVTIDTHQWPWHQCGQFCSTHIVWSMSLLCPELNKKTHLKKALNVYIYVWTKGTNALKNVFMKFLCTMCGQGLGL